MEIPVAIGDYLRTFRRFWWLVVVAAILGAGVGYATTFFSTPEYQSTARLFVTTQSGTSVGDAYQNNLFSQERVVSYAGLATSAQVAARAVDQLKMPITPDELRAKITATPLPKTVLLDISVTDTDPVVAQTYANAVSDQLVQLVSELETSRRGGTPAAGAILLDDANYPTTPSGPSLLTLLGLGAVGGAVVGLLIAIGIGAFDSRLRARDSVEAVTRSHALGALVADPRRPDVPVTNLAAGGLAAERLRELRTNLQFARTRAGQRPTVIAVTSPSRGDGRTTTAIDLAAAFAESGRSVLLVEGDFVNPVLVERLALTDAERVRAVQRGLGTALAGDHEVSAAVIPSIGGTSFALLPAGPQASTRRRLWGDEAAGHVIEELRASFEYIVIDTPPLNETSDGAVVAALGDGAIVLARIGHTTTKGLRAAIQVLEAANAESIGTVVTCEPGHKRELSKQPVEAPAAVVAPREKPGPADTTAATVPPRETRDGGTGQTGPVEDQATEAINQAGAHRLPGVKHESR
ncbi:polysaccharide biosynthesis tyrosine autokinase [Mycobacterium sp. AZCC_0083]|uniref:polysaccharide biosynthesis tyrosine autokinase n=1 Tax=Mycobacterium sp. AZCC_0083 TaxID=2735882 RepID=UPI0017DA126B|nr:polysaccharide biosynthesis tyrosine autokinase [Mycobacterium sp. AZCC_0083]MBB5165818.1 receptor protein-tyrosine kinase [Mycobacterium sp. AZCC_0083]